MIAVQGPKAAALVEPLLGSRPLALRYYHAVELPLAGFPGEPVAIVSRTGYTGEDGWELVVPARRAVEVWRRLLEIGSPLGAQAAGLAARDTLRLEAAMPLYGHELVGGDPSVSGRVGFRRAARRARFSGLRGAGKSLPRAVAIDSRRLEAERPARAARKVSGAGGRRRSGRPRDQRHVFADAQMPIAMGYCQPAFARPGTEVLIDIRGRHEPATVVELPFYRRSG